MESLSDLKEDCVWKVLIRIDFCHHSLMKSCFSFDNRIVSCIIPQQNHSFLMIIRSRVFDFWKGGSNYGKCIHNIRTSMPNLPITKTNGRESKSYTVPDEGWNPVHIWTDRKLILVVSCGECCGPTTSFQLVCVVKLQNSTIVINMEFVTYFTAIQHFVFVLLQAKVTFLVGGLIVSHFLEAFPKASF